MLKSSCSVTTVLSVVTAFLGCLQMDKSYEEDSVQVKTRTAFVHGHFLILFNTSLIYQFCIHRNKKDAIFFESLRQKHGKDEIKAWELVRYCDLHSPGCVFSSSNKPHHFYFSTRKTSLQRVFAERSLDATDSIVLMAR